MKDTTAFFTSALAESDPEIFGAMTKELGRQRDEIECHQDCLNCGVILKKLYSITQLIQLKK